MSFKLIEAVAIGWRIRRIMRTKEVIMRIKQIHEYDHELTKSDLDKELRQMLKMSKFNTKLKLSSLI